MQTTEDIIALIARGANVEIKSAGRSVDDLVEIATSAAKHNVRLAIDANKNMEDLIDIIEAGRGAVTLKIE